MPHPMTGPVVGFASRLRFPTLFKVTLALMVLSWLLPDPIPFMDEIITALATLVLANWKRSEPPPAPREPIEGESRRE
ncbi:MULTISPECIES: DUF6116 family protein [Arenimonas]|nr:MULTISPECIES: DUF6116 family protein [Arenimonas]